LALLSPDGSRVVLLEQLRSDLTARVINLAVTEEPERTLEGFDYAPGDTVFFASHGRLLCNMFDGWSRREAPRSPQFWDLHPRKSDERAAASELFRQGNQGEAKFITLSPDHQWLVTWESDGTFLWYIGGPEAPSPTSLRGVRTTLFGPDSSSLFVASDEGLQVYDVSGETPKQVGEIRGKEFAGGIRAGCLSPGRDRVAIVDVASEVRVWDLGKGPKQPALVLPPLGGLPGFHGNDVYRRQESHLLSLPRQGACLVPPHGGTEGKGNRRVRGGTQ
jgi:hypothetical protein